MSESAMGIMAAADLIAEQRKIIAEQSKMIAESVRMAQSAQQAYEDMFKISQGQTEALSAIVDVIFRSPIDTGGPLAEILLVIKGSALRAQGVVAMREARQ